MLYSHHVGVNTVITGPCPLITVHINIQVIITTVKAHVLNLALIKKEILGFFNLDPVFPSFASGGSPKQDCNVILWGNCALSMYVH